MSPGPLQPLQGSSIRLSAFRESLDRIWRRSRGRAIGLAISGGVDSMALASLCASWKSSTWPRPEVIGFIVDHGLRDNSSSEAEEVARELRRLRLGARVLKLGWRGHGDPAALSNFESVARNLRYRAIGTACVDADADSLLVAHHADDQAETVMVRMLSKYLGTGLRGMRAEAVLPECNGFYGLFESGRPRNAFTSQPTHFTRPVGGLQTEHGGIAMHRPLLQYTKAALVATCVENRVRWFEDHTNADLTLTLRNTVRYLQQSDQLPSALRTSRLLQLASCVDNRERQRETDAQQVVEKLSVSLDPRIGKATFTFHLEALELPSDASATRGLVALVLRRLARLVSPAESQPLQDLLPQVEFLLGEAHVSDSTQRQQPQLIGPSVAGVVIARDINVHKHECQTSYTLSRVPPTALDKQRSAETMLDSTPHDTTTSERRWTDWRLWDGRFWIRVQPPRRPEGQQVESVLVRFLVPTDLASLHEELPRASMEKLKRSLRRAPGKLRFTLPALVQTRTLASEETYECVVALPSLGWSIEKWSASSQQGGLADGERWLYDIHYKKVD